MSKEQNIEINISEDGRYTFPSEFVHCIKVADEAMKILHIAGRCDFCGQCTDWPNDYCVSCKEEGFDKLHKKKKELEKDRLHA